MKLEVTDKCIGCGACVGSYPNFFDFNEEGYAYCKVEEIEEKDNEDAQNALKICPMDAIIEQKEDVENSNITEKKD